MKTLTASPSASASFSPRMPWHGHSGGPVTGRRTGRIIGQQVITDPGQVPIRFSISYDPSKIVPNHTYAVQAVISDRGR